MARQTNDVWVYIASPYRIGNKARNVKRQEIAALRLGDLGYVPVWPLCNHYIDRHHRRPETYWLSQDLKVLRGCNALLRLSGKSAGADMEVAFAHRHRIPVFYSVRELRKGKPVPFLARK